MNVITTQKSDEFAQLYSYLKEDLNKDFYQQMQSLLWQGLQNPSVIKISTFYTFLEYLILIGQLQHLTVGCFLVLPVVHDNGVYLPE